MQRLDENDIELHFQNGTIDEYQERRGIPATRSEEEKKPMIICQCNGVSDRAIRKAVRDGASNRNDVVRACTAGTTCGGCVPAIDEIIETERERIVCSSLTVLELATS